MCVCERESVCVRERECVCVCERERERERGRKVETKGSKEAQEKRKPRMKQCVRKRVGVDAVAITAGMVDVVHWSPPSPLHLFFFAVSLRLALT